MLAIVSVAALFSDTDKVKEIKRKMPLALFLLIAVFFFSTNVLISIIGVQSKADKLLTCRWWKEMPDDVREFLLKGCLFGNLFVLSDKAQQSDVNYSEYIDGNENLFVNDDKQMRPVMKAYPYVPLILVFGNMVVLIMTKLPDWLNLKKTLNDNKELFSQWKKWKEKNPDEDNSKWITEKEEEQNSKNFVKDVIKKAAHEEIMTQGLLILAFVCVLIVYITVLLIFFTWGFTYFEIGHIFAEDVMCYGKIPSKSDSLNKYQSFLVSCVALPVKIQRELMIVYGVILALCFIGLAIYGAVFGVRRRGSSTPNVFVSNPHALNIKFACELMQRQLWEKGAQNSFRLQEFLRMLSNDEEKRSKEEKMIQGKKH